MQESFDLDRYDRTLDELKAAAAALCALGINLEKSTPLHTDVLLHVMSNRMYDAVEALEEIRPEG